MDMSSATQIFGCVDLVSDRGFFGWAFDASTPEPLQITLVIDGADEGAVFCDGTREDVLRAGFGRDRVGFHLPIPPAYRDGRRHVAQLFDPDGRLVVLEDSSGQDRLEWGFTLTREYALAFIDPWQSGDISCWAIVVDGITGENRPAERVVARQNGQAVATLWPSRDRPDVAAAHGCHPRCGFALHWRDMADLDPSALLHLHVEPDGREMDAPVMGPIRSAPMTRIAQTSQSASGKLA